MEHTEPIIIPSLEALDVFTKELIASFPEQDHAIVLALSGDLGAGKTAFVQSLAKNLGVSEPVTSPTFTIMKRYETTHDTLATLFHMDAYRLESEGEVVPLRLDSIFESKQTIFCIEWAERILSVLPKDTIFLNIKINPSDDRILTFN